MPWFKCMISMIGISLLAACTSVAPDPYAEPGAGPSPAEQTVNACNLRGHLQCIHLTGKEVLEDGAQGQWTRHWWRMSYIGRACEEQYGRTTGVIVEGLFAVPHYFAIGFGNAAAAMTYPFREKQE